MRLVVVVFVVDAELEQQLLYLVAQVMEDAAAFAAHTEVEGFVALEVGLPLEEAAALAPQSDFGDGFDG